jgi:hypothetical protein
MGKHTPDPWIEIYDDDYSCVNITTEYRDGSIIPICRVDVGFVGEIEDEQRENIKLIKAAPDLLAALKDLLGDRHSVQGGICQVCGRDYLPEMIDGDCPSEDCPSFIARAAIALAEAVQS